MDAENEMLVPFSARFVVCSNRPEADAQWESGEKEWVGKASMSKRHRFVTTKDLRWVWFNVLTFGLESAAQLAEGIEILEQLRAAALTYARVCDGWSERDVDLCFHVYGHSSVPSLHLHVLGRRHLGPTHAALALSLIHI